MKKRFEIIFELILNQKNLINKNKNIILQKAE